MNKFINQAEEILLPEAEKYCPDGTEAKAIVHQWLTAIAYGESLFANNPGKQTVINTLKKNRIYKSKSDLKSKLHENQIFMPPKEPKFTFIDLFAGIGGFRLALQDQKGLAVFSSEWDKGAQATYNKNYGELPFGDITAMTNPTVSDEQLDIMIPNHDLLAAGFPCQPFSHAGVSARTSVGKEHGFECKTQGTLFFDVLRIASIKKPKVLFLENVRNIERHDKGYTFKTIKDSIEELGYDFRFSIIDSSSLVPQRRVRCYMVCFRKDLKIEFQFPKFSGDALPLKSILENDVPEKYTISDKLWAGHINRTKRNLERGTGFTAFTADIDKPSKTIVARYGKDGKECLIPQDSKNPRFLTPRECARLQGFPEAFYIPEAKTPAYRQFGNSVAVPVVTRLAEEITKEIL
ncbi:MAG: DNA (cytosine-5-)-methyltransferase [Pseudomonadales bacterium]|nr:DNA (cytosine-5-)-methyltransferase [Pseudomonadales bacterium]